MSNTFHDLKISSIIEETADSKSLIFDVPSSLTEQFNFKAGQYLTLKFELNGKEERRSYSLSSAPIENQWRVCCKRVQNGLVSNHICDNLKVGDHVSVMAPEGRFTFEPNEEKEASYVLFAAGSGITPILSIAKQILEKEPLSTVYLLYGNRNEQGVIYKNELENLVQKYAGQFHLKYTYSAIKEKKGMFGGMFKKTNFELPYLPGRVSKDTIKLMLKNYESIRPAQAYAFICGPGSMNEDVKKQLIKEGFPQSNIYFESFGTTAEAEGLTSSEGMQAKAKVELDKNTFEIDIPKNMTILDALIEKGYDPPHSCCSGACSSCMAKLESGKVAMEVAHALDEDDIEDGYILTCQARCTTSEIHVVYE